MKIEFQNRANGPQNLVSEAELVFGPEDGPLQGLKLVGLSLWRVSAERARARSQGSGAEALVHSGDAEGASGRTERPEMSVTLPARVWGEGSERRYYDFLRPTDGEFEHIRKFKQWVSEAYRSAR
jgi:hypothetical protein